MTLRITDDRSRAQIVDLALAALAIYALTALSYETVTARVEMSRARQARGTPPTMWHWGMADVDALASCEHEAALLTPIDQPLRLSAAGPTAWLRWRWAAYLQPDRDVQQATLHEPAGTIVFAQDASSRPAFSRLVSAGPDCRVYRVHRPPKHRPRPAPHR